MRVCDGIAAAWVLCYKLQSLSIRDDITQHNLGASVT